jgi:hypothetical protein
MFEKEGMSSPGTRLEVVEFRALDGSLFEIIATMMPQGPTFFLRPGSIHSLKAGHVPPIE